MEQKRFCRRIGQGLRIGGMGAAAKAFSASIAPKVRATLRDGWQISFGRRYPVGHGPRDVSMPEGSMPVLAWSCGALGQMVGSRLRVIANCPLSGWGAEVGNAGQLASRLVGPGREVIPTDARVMRVITLPAA